MEGRLVYKDSDDDEEIGTRPAHIRNDINNIINPTIIPVQRRRKPSIPIGATKSSGGEGGEGGEKEDAFEDADEEVVYSNYQPAMLKIGHEHPDLLVQSASLAAVLPPAITYELKLPNKLIESRALSSAQLETVVYASQIHEKYLTTGARCGFFLGDGAGVGKGRQLAACVLENWSQGRRRHIWLSAHADLSFDASRDLKDIGAEHIKAQPLKDLAYGSIGDFEGVIFSTYTALTSKSKTGQSRLMQLVNWCKKDFDGCILFGK